VLLYQDRPDQAEHAGCCDLERLDDWVQVAADVRLLGTKQAIGTRVFTTSPSLQVDMPGTYGSCSPRGLTTRVDTRSTASV